MNAELACHAVMLTAAGPHVCGAAARSVEGNIITNVNTNRTHTTTTVITKAEVVNDGPLCDEGGCYHLSPVRTYPLNSLCTLSALAAHIQHVGLQKVWKTKTSWCSFMVRGRGNGEAQTLSPCACSSVYIMVVNGPHHTSRTLFGKHLPLGRLAGRARRCCR